MRSHDKDGVSAASRVKVALQDLATWLSRLELALAFLAAALLGALLSALLEIIAGEAPDAVGRFAIGLFICLMLTVMAWALARFYSQDLGACFVIRKVQLSNRPAVSARLSRSSRSWLPLEMVDSPEAWSDGLPASVVQLASNLATPLADSVGRPRVLLALSTSDAVGFLLGNLLRPSFLGADVQILTLPTGSQSWQPARYRIGHRAHRDLFEGDETSGAACQCDLPKGTGVVDALRSPNHNPEVVLGSLLSQRIICCTQAVYLISGDRRTNEPASDREVENAVRFLRARSRWLVGRQTDREVGLTLTVGPEASLLAGFLLSGFCRWRVWEFDQGEGSWKTRWKSA